MTSHTTTILKIEVHSIYSNSIQLASFSSHPNPFLLISSVSSQSFPTFSFNLDSHLGFSIHPSVFLSFHSIPSTYPYHPNSSITSHPNFSSASPSCSLIPLSSFSFHPIYISYSNPIPFASCHPTLFSHIIPLPSLLIISSNSVPSISSHSDASYLNILPHFSSCIFFFLISSRFNLSRVIPSNHLIPSVQEVVTHFL